MLHIPKWKIVLIIATCVLGILYALPNLLSSETADELPSWIPHEQVNLGLDLQGGSYLLLEVDLQAVLKERMISLSDAVRTTLRKERIKYTGLHVEKDAVIFKLMNGQDEALRDKVYKLLFKLEPNDGEASVTSDGNGRLVLSAQALALREKAAMEQTREIVQRRIDETGTREPLIQQQGTDRILIQLPGLGDPSRIKKLLGQTAKLAFRMVDHGASVEEAQEGRLPPGSEILMEHAGDSTIPYVIRKTVVVSGEMLVDSQPGFNEGFPVVTFRFDSVGARKFGEATRQNVGRQFAIILDNKVISAPVINEPIMGGSGQISGRFTVQQASDLALLLRAGALPAPLTILEERTIGPGLGADSIEAGERATVLAIILVAIFMFIAYASFGGVANTALVFNMIILIAALSVLQATLTLPGIAGIALTLGMAVDANVLIYERIKEELRLGKKVFSAVDAGYSRAMATIIDSNITTLIGAMFLYQFGTGPIRGFAVTLALGIIISMFTSISLTRLIVVTYIKWKRPQTLSI
ncbi:MAG: protein translocase subunit SecD [Alphaproteobacteria bacterium]|jgi:preprotein translocase subunit SecD|nr:protein translocase subunit SecD [Alphaproteobacteria bacterium]MBT5390260.1 protein translocase subunit SecD [Alphaproteobacteria bacterium]MBT5654228.1 protein translocase subunit SecD [Alphaproteobacteria bacterium]